MEHMGETRMIQETSLAVVADDTLEVQPHATKVDRRPPLCHDSTRVLQNAVQPTAARHSCSSVRNNNGNSSSSICRETNFLLTENDDHDGDDEDLASSVIITPPDAENNSRQQQQTPPRSQTLFSTSFSSSMMIRRPSPFAASELYPSWSSSLPPLSHSSSSSSSSSTLGEAHKNDIGNIHIVDSCHHPFEHDDGDDRDHHHDDSSLPVLQQHSPSKDRTNQHSNAHPTQKGMCCPIIMDQFHTYRLYIGTVVTNTYFQLLMVVLIIINAIMLGIATFDFVSNDAHVSHQFDTVDFIFLIIFTIELGMQLIYLGYHLFHDGWLLFDFVIIVSSWSLQSLQIIRAFRAFRALRLIARIKVLRDLMNALGQVLPRLYAIAALLLLVFYIFAVFFTELFGTLILSDNYFRTLDVSLFTCFQFMTVRTRIGERERRRESECVRAK
jgi:hypothetical protein